MEKRIFTIQWIEGSLKIIDQTQLPLKLKYLYCRDIKDVFGAIKKMQVRGAPVLGIAAGFGLFLGIKDSQAKDFKEFKRNLDRAIRYLSKSRPTAVNTFWALERMKKKAEENSHRPISKIKEILLNEAKNIYQEDRIICRKMAKFGSSLIKDGDRILTICNAGSLATADYGTALGVIYRAREEKKGIKVYVCETRPLLQGARLSCWELKKRGIDVTLICDSMAASIMKEGKINEVFVGADRISKNGDVANKVGTYNLSVLAKFHNIPFYVVAPTSSFDLKIKDGEDIPIEERDTKEVTHLFFKSPIAPPDVKVANKAFDVTDHSLITCIVTERGIIYPPYKDNIVKLLNC